MNNNKLYTCPVCGFPELDEPPYDEAKCPTYIICPCCGVEFGFDDATATFKELRQKWKAQGMPWRSTSQPPPLGWSPKKQLNAVIEGSDEN